MPRVVDHQARRAEVAAIAADLIARRGIDRVSLRDVAAAGGYSTTVVTHYFASKRELLQHAYRSAGTDTEARLAGIGPAGDRLLAICEAILPLDEPRRRTWQIWFAFFGAAIADEELAAMQRRRVQHFRELLTAELDGDHDAARELLVLVRGIATEAVFDLEDWPPERQRQQVEHAIARLRAQPEERA